MRFSAVQEDGYGVGLGQETPPNDVDENIMAATGDDVELGGNNGVEEGSMISNLPLLFANGYPTSLDKITLPELERFVTFMVQCSLGHDTADGIREPPWWPKEIKFATPFVRPKKINENYMGNLKKLVFRCYTYHRSEYLLRFCSYLAQYPHDKLEYVNNWDSTTSLYLKTTGKLLVTFRNENMNYDRKFETSRKQLLLKRAKDYPNGTKNLRRRSAQKQAPSPAMVEPAIEDIYLCDNCDAEFVGIRKMKEHEKLCYRVEPRPPTPEAEEVPEIKQDQFMEYFHLTSTNTDPSRGSSTLSSKDGVSQNRSSGRIRGSVNLTRCPTIPFSSPAGLALGKKSKMMTEAIQQERLERIERHLCAPPLSTSFKPKWLTKIYDFDRWSITYKSRCDKALKSDEYAHEFKFGNYSGKPVLDLRSQLLYISCKPIYAVANRLTEEELEELQRDPSRYRSPERKVPRVRLRSPSVEHVYEPTYDDEPVPIVIDLVDDDIESAPSPTPTPPPSAPLPSTQPLPTYRPLVPMPSLSSTINFTSLPATSRVSSLRCRPTPTPSPTSTTPTNMKRPKPSKPVVFVDLCSSDEEEQQSGYPSSYVSIDENHDPMQKRKSTTTANNVPPMEVIIDPSFDNTSLLSPNSKISAKSCIYPADSSMATGNWLTSLNVDGASTHRDSLLKNSPRYKNTP